MDTYKKKWTITMQQVFDALSEKAGERMSQREIAQMIGASPTAVGNAIHSLGEIALTNKQKTINFITLNRESSFTIGIKRSQNLRNIYETKLIDYLERELAGSTLILFGSYAQGMDTSHSDIDIACIGRKEKRVSLESFEKILKRKIIINFYDSLKNVQQNLRNNILSGIVLSGGIEL